MQTIDRRDRTLGVLWILFGILCALEATWLAVNSNVLRLMWGALLERVPNPYPWMGLFNLLLLSAIVLTVLTTIFSILGAIALMQRETSNRRWAMVVAVLALMCNPLGIALGTYTMVYLMQRPVSSAYARIPAAA